MSEEPVAEEEVLLDVDIVSSRTRIWVEDVSGKESESSRGTCFYNVRLYCPTTVILLKLVLTINR